MIKNAGMTPIAFNDGIGFANKTYASIGSTTYTFDKDIVVCYWSGGWSGYNPRTAPNLVSDGFKIINTTGDFYYVLGKNDNFDSSYTYASNWSNHKVCGNTLSSSAVLGGMFCMWSDYPGAETETQEASKIRLPLRAMGLAMNDAYTYNLDDSVVPGGFNTDGTLNTEPPAQVHSYQLTSSVAPTCTEDGNNTYIFVDCGEVYTETVSALGHDYLAEDNCGDTVYSCTRCGDSYTEFLPKENITLKIGQTSETYTFDEEKTVSVYGDESIARANLTYNEGTEKEVSYSATASASVAGYTQGGYNCVISNIIDGDTSTYYWSTASQSVGMYARVDLGAEVRFDAVQVSAPAHGDYCTNANVQVSSDGYTWTTLGTFTSSRSTSVTKTYTVPDSIESFRYIQVTIANARSYWWQLSEIAWGSLNGSSFTRAAVSGTVQTGVITTTALSFTGVGAGTTSYVVDGVKYVIEVEENHVHTWEKISETYPTCTSDGFATYTCSVCGDSYTSDVTVALGHRYECVEENGNLTYTCTVCGDTYSEPSMPTVDIELIVGETYTFTTDNADITEHVDSSIATVNIHTNEGSYNAVSSLTDGKFLIILDSKLLTNNSTTYYSSWDNAGTIYGLTCIPYSQSGSYSDYLWTFTKVDGGYTVRSSDGRYLTITPGTRSANLTLAETEQVIDITDLGDTFALGYKGTYLDRYNSTFVASYPGGVNENEKWELYKSEATSYDIMITAVSGGITSTIIGGTKYNVNVHEHDYISEITSVATCTDDGIATHTCAGCGNSYTEVIEAYGHDYECTEENGFYVYTCRNCNAIYTEEISSTHYEYISSLTADGKYVVTLYDGSSYYALTHNGTSLGVTTITVRDNEIVSEVTEDMLWKYANKKLGFDYGTNAYYLSRSNGYYSSLFLSTSGSTVTYSRNRLSVGSYYLRYSNGNILSSKFTYSSCYIFSEAN